VFDMFVISYTEGVWR